MQHTSRKALARPHVALLAVAASALLAACGGGSGEAPGQASSNDTQRLSPASTGGAGAPVVTVESGTGWTMLSPPAPDLPDASPVPEVAYHVSWNTGSNPPDPVPPNHGRTPQTAFKTLAAAVKQLKTPTLDDGQTYALLLRCGEGWREQITLRGDGVYSNVNANPKAKLLISTYGSDCATVGRPVIQASDWVGITDTQNNWQAGAQTDQYFNATIASPVEQVFLDNLPLTKARYPNANPQDGKPTYWRAKGLDVPTKQGFKLDYAALEQTDPTTVTKLKNGTYPLVGALVHVRTNPWIIETGQVTAFNPATGEVSVLAWDPETKLIAKKYVNGAWVDKTFDNLITSDAGLILEGLNWMLDAPGEWHHAGTRLTLNLPTPIPVNKTLKDRLANLEVSRRDFGINVYRVDNVQVERLAFKHQAVSGIKMQEGGGFRVSGIRSEFAQENGVQVMSTTPGFPALIEKSHITRAGAAGIIARRTPGITIRQNVVTSTGLFGRARNTAGAISVLAGKQNEVNFGAEGGLVEDNHVRDAANSGIMFYNAKGLTVRRNSVAFSCKRLTDCGGIYTVGDGPFPAGAVTEVNEDRSTIANNVVFHGVSDYTGYYNTTARNQAMGIYLDETSTRVKVLGNTVSSTEVGIYLHDAFNNTVDGNTVRAVTYASFMGGQSRPEPSLYGNVVSNNSFVGYRRIKGMPPRRSSANPNASTEILDLDADEVFAQFWSLKTGDPATLFTTTERAPNQSLNNKVLTVDNGQVPVWRRGVSPDKGDHMSNGARARWAFRTDVNGVGVRPLALADWRVYAPTDEEVTAPVAYKQYALGVVPQPADSLVKPIFDPSWSSPTGTFSLPTPGADPGWLSSSQNVDLVSTAFNVTTAAPGNLYLARYTVKGGDRAGPAGGTHRVFLRDASYQNVGLWQPALKLKPAEQVKVEQFFWGHSTSQPNKVNFDDARLWFVTTSSPATGTDIFLSGVSLLKIDESLLSFQPPMNELAFHVVNLTGATQRLDTCAATQLPTCVLAREDGSTMSWPLDLAPGQSVYLFRKTGPWVD